MDKYELLNKKFKSYKIDPAIKGALYLSLAFSVTALLTTHYFGIGAEGFTVIEILKTCMERAIELKVPLIAELSEAKNWYEAK